MNWYCCELHAHTIHSDGHMTPQELLKRAKQNGLDLIALTDHNTVAGVGELPFLPGMEWTTYHGHMVVLGAERFVDWRDAGVGPVDHKLRAIHEAGGVATVAHPFQLGSPVSTGSHWEMRVDDWELIDAWEIWHSYEPPYSLEDGRSLREWTRLLDEGCHIAAVYGRDWQRPDENAVAAVTCLGMSGACSRAGALDAIRAGRTLVTMGPVPVVTAAQGGTTLYPGDTLHAGCVALHISVDECRRRDIWVKWGVTVNEIRVVGAGGQALRTVRYHGEPVEIQLDAQPGWLRVELAGELLGHPCEVAVVSPFYVV